MSEWIDFTLHAVAGAVAFLCLFEATRRIGAYGLHRAAVLMFVLSSAACAFAAGFAYQKYSTLSAVVASNQRQPPPAAKVVTASYIKPGTTPEKKEHLGLVVARQTFLEFGALASYVDRNGEPRTFAPGADDLKARERIVAYYTQTEFAARASLAESLLWVIGAVVAVFVGLAMSLAKPPVPRSPEEEALAAEPPLHR